MEKQRVLPIDYGLEEGRQLFYAYSRSTSEYMDPDVRDSGFLARQYALGSSAAATPFSLGAVDGYQRFESSEYERPAYNSCRNTKLTGFMYPYGLTHERYNTGSTIYVTPYSVISSSYPVTTGKTFVTSGQNLATSYWAAAEGARRRAWWNMQPRFEGRISMLNFIFELKDFRDIMKHVVRLEWRDLSENMRSLKKLLQRAETSSGITDPLVGDVPRLVRYLDASTRGLAVLHLTNQFAIQPTIRDVLSITLQAQRTVTEAQASFEQKGQQTNRAHYSESLFNDVSKRTTYTNNYYWRQYVESQKARFTASMEFLYTYRKRPPFAAAKRYWGLDLNAEVVWNALPLSFLFDYVIGIGDAIHAMRNDPNVDLKLMQYCESILYERKAAWVTKGDSRTCWVCINGKIDSGDKDDLDLTGYKFSSYDRRVTSPNYGSALPIVHWPSFGQIGTVAALIRCWL